MSLSFHHQRRIAAQAGTAVVTADGKGAHLDVLAIHFRQAPQLLVDILAIDKLAAGLIQNLILRADQVDIVPAAPG
jgi:hypothetical protein